MRGELLAPRHGLRTRVKREEDRASERVPCGGVDVWAGKRLGRDLDLTDEAVWADGGRARAPHLSEHLGHEAGLALGRGRLLQQRDVLEQL